MSSIALNQGLLIAIEGIDGAGKSTLARHLAQRLDAAGLATRSTHEPTDGPFGRRLRASAQRGRLDATEELALFLQDRAQHVTKLIQPALDQGAIVITDRYYFSTIAYQGARGLDPREIRARNEAIAPPPDLLVLCDLPIDLALERIERHRGDIPNAFEHRDALTRCRDLFLAAARETPHRLILDASQPTEVSAQAVLDSLLGGVLVSRVNVEQRDLLRRRLRLVDGD